jgi:hypothetical protein
MWNLIPFLPFLIGLVPVFVARTWPARITAIVFGLASVGFGVYFTWGIAHTPFQRVGVPIIGGLSTALISVVVTYIVDKKYVTKA